MNAKCRICRRKTDPENMLLCDGCDRGHHLYCMKPKLKSVPQGDWFCITCKPKERVKSPKKKSRQVFSTTEEDDQADVDSDNESVADDAGNSSDGGEVRCRP
jgi:bromodomain adjacent to zinc finger domain protein 1A